MNAIKLYRASRWFYNKKIPLMPKLLHGLIFLIFNSHIPYTCSIGKNTKFAYGSIGVVLHSHCTIGNNCIIGTGVTIGGNKSSDINPPQIGDSCYIATGAKVLGDIMVGSGSFIGANAVLTKNKIGMKI